MRKVSDWADNFKRGFTLIVLGLLWLLWEKGYINLMEAIALFLIFIGIEVIIVGLAKRRERRIEERTS